jgi:23S rRNA (cytidine1920-2'-O)/16S rRNA (cytidine1409-2'-O)-methyltransferase
MTFGKKPKSIPLLSLLKERFPESSKKEQYARVLCGEVLIEGECIRDPAQRVPADSTIEFRTQRFVSRGGDKLQAALNRWDLKIKGKIILDAGSSAGGFTDCLLQHGAGYVYAVDVGYNQLDYKLRHNSAVAVYERTNIMSLHTLDPPPHGAVADLSFRSVRKAASHILSLTVEKWLIALIKPQFEIPKGAEPNFNGVITENKVLAGVLSSVIDDLWKEKAYVTDLMQSPITGRRGNREYLFYINDKPSRGAAQLKEQANSAVFKRSFG